MTRPHVILTALSYYFTSYFNRIGVLFGIYYYLNSLFTRTCCDLSGKFLDSTLFNALSCVFKSISSIFYSFLVYLNMHDCNHKDYTEHTWCHSHCHSRVEHKLQGIIHNIQWTLRNYRQCPHLSIHELL